VGFPQRGVDGSTPGPESVAQGGDSPLGERPFWGSGFALREGPRFDFASTGLHVWCVQSAAFKIRDLRWSKSARFAN
jgi:hypothetical protein